MTVAEMLARISSAELTDWIVYEEAYGTLGPARGDLQAGIVAATVANVNRAKGRRPYKPADFMPTWDRPKITEPTAMAAMLRSLTQALGGRIRRRGED